MNKKNLRKNELYTYRTDKGDVKGVCYTESFVLSNPTGCIGSKHFVFKYCGLSRQEIYESCLLGYLEVEEKVSIPNYSVWSLRYFPLDHNDLSAIYWVAKDVQNDYMQIEPMGENIVTCLFNGSEDELGLLIQQMEQLKVDEIIKGSDDNCIVALNKVIYHATVKLRLITEESTPGIITSFQRKLSSVIQ